MARRLPETARREASHGCHHLSQPGLRDFAQHLGDDPQCGRRAACHRISEDAAISGYADSAYRAHGRSEEHTSELQSIMRIPYAVLLLKKKQHTTTIL